MKAQEMISTPTQQDYQRQLAAMYRQGYRELHPEKLRKALFDYFLFLENTISGTLIAECADSDFTVAELEALNCYQEAALKRYTSKNRLAAPLP